MAARKRKPNESFKAYRAYLLKSDARNIPRYLYVSKILRMLPATEQTPTIKYKVVEYNGPARRIYTKDGLRYVTGKQFGKLTQAA